uniref:Uncharacterized protein n=1 Tax=Utricularia reniformis TaxID=192314 RepID=A0A1Y0B286_9LAMI|nr:hypothetical protein AEK19_MT1306 [Utricularia reniformis]ART31507.1 hypothetical protein AEK19_MT1306 [Utricularia reniformis]
MWNQYGIYSTRLGNRLNNRISDDLTDLDVLF